MPTLTDQPDRHVVIDRREGHYICFPDVMHTGNGNLIVIYNEAEKHVRPERRALIYKTSPDNGRNWSNVKSMGDERSHCPRMIQLPEKELMIVDSGLAFRSSKDNGQTWETFRVVNLPHDMLDRPIDLGDGIFLTTGHAHRGTYPHPAIRQAPSEQMVYRSEDRGKSWKPLSVLAHHRNLVLCEASMVRLPDGRIAALMRENSFVYEPMYLCISENDGGTWSDPMPTPLIGHRPTMGFIPDGRLMVTYRDVSPDPGTRAWVGTLDELLSDFQVHGRAVDPANPTMTPDGLRIYNYAGEDSVVRYALRPLTDPRSATATLEAEVRVDKADRNGCAIRLGTWWRIYPDRIEPDVEDPTPVTIEPGRFNTIRLEYESGMVTLLVNGEKKTAVKVDDDHADTRPILFGAPYPFEDNAVDCKWRRVSLSTSEPTWSRKYAWEWKAADGLPDGWARDNTLELKNARKVASPDFGYSGWTTLEDGSFFCAYHHAENDDDYEPLFSSHIQGTWFSLDDFK